MRVLHLGANVASQISAAVRGLRAIGVDVRGLVDVWKGDVVQSHDCLERLPEYPEKKSRESLQAARTQLCRYRKVLAAIYWADILHWHFGEVLLPNGVDLQWVRTLRKPGIAEFWGSDIRIAEVELADNPYFAYAPSAYRDALTYARSHRVQAMFSRAGFDCVVASDAMARYVQRELFEHVYCVRQRLPLSDYVPRFPDPACRLPRVVHSPTNPLLKGTPMVLSAVDRLRPRLDFDFHVIHRVPHAEAVAQLAEADIFVDQFVLGEHGIATLEAMALGKPVICYLKGSMVNWYPPECPVVNANADNLPDVLEGLIRDGARRRELGRKGREYVEKYHDSIALARQLVSIYQEIIGRRMGAGACEMRKSLRETVAPARVNGAIVE